VWRGENTQRGRYREFTQCDFDIVGTTSVSSDLEILLMMYRAFEALGISDITIKINHRGVFNRFLEKISSREHSTGIMRAIDKIGKIGDAQVRELLLEFLSPDRADAVLEYIRPKEAFTDTLQTITDLAGGDEDDTRRLRQLYDGFVKLGIEDKIFLDSSIMRGLDYYTGIVYETFFNRLPGIGSVCSGGRYDNLASLYTKTELPGVGSSIGLDRLVAALEELGEVDFTEQSADIAVFCLDESLIGYYHRTAEFFRRAGLRCDVFYEKKKLNQQFKLAERKNIPVVIICGDEEERTGTVSMKDIVSGTSYNRITMEEAVGIISDILNK
jgi:histidyl-tRNA synthetase